MNCDFKEKRLQLLSVRGTKKSESARALANTLVSFSSRLALTLTLSDGACNFSFEEYAFFARVATRNSLIYRDSDFL